VPVNDFLARLADVKARAIIRERIARLMLGNAGDVKSVGGGVSELRVAFGPGYRLYYAEQGRTVVVCAGTKATQSRDIRRAKTYLEDYWRLTGNAERVR
jgi:putative addiction module killer protein